ncbi:MAG: hypothetical protein ACE5OZ_14810 [Candidatus Heimdallarchaeota archaeon]
MDILEATHQEGQYPTLYSNIFDLVNRDIYLGDNYTYDKVVKLNLDAELAKGPHRCRIADSFSEENGSEESATSSSSSAGFEFLFAVLAFTGAFLGI